MPPQLLEFAGNDLLDAVDQFIGRLACFAFDRRDAREVETEATGDGQEVVFHQAPGIIEAAGNDFRIRGGQQQSFEAGRLEWFEIAIARSASFRENNRRDLSAGNTLAKIVDHAYRTIAIVAIDERMMAEFQVGRDRRDPLAQLLLGDVLPVVPGKGPGEQRDVEHALVVGDENIGLLRSDLRRNVHFQLGAQQGVASHQRALQGHGRALEALDPEEGGCTENEIVENQNPGKNRGVEDCHRPIEEPLHAENMPRSAFRFHSRKAAFRGWDSNRNQDRKKSSWLLRNFPPDSWLL